MLRISVSQKYFEEKSYTLSVLLKEILGLEYSIDSRPDQSDYEISFEDKKIIIEDHFFNNFPGDLTYLANKNVPNTIKMFKNKFTLEEDVPIIWGEDRLIVNNEIIKCGLDIFSSAFFLLSRWEEYVVNEKDNHSRFEAKSSLMGKMNILHRPLVNEYAEMLWNILKYLGYSGERKSNKPEFLITHDIDQPLRLFDLKMMIKSAGRDLLMFKDAKGAALDVVIYFFNKINNKYDPGNIYDFFMDLSEQVGAKSQFYFQNAKKTPFDWGFDVNSKLVQGIFENIKKRDHIIGFHPSYFTYNNSELWTEEYNGLCHATGIRINRGRQHYLRFEVPTTWQIWDDNNMEYDSTVGYAEKEGFRCGTCSTYSVYNILTRKKLRLKEMPLTLMELALMRYQKNVSASEFLQRTNKLMDTTRKYGGNFVLLFHNSYFDRKIYTLDLYSKIIELYR
jgi:Family of unknown function (DUF7033)